MNNTNENVLAIENLTVSFDIDGKKCPAIKNLSLNVKSGELVALVGESGCGKTLCASFAMGLGPVTAKLDSGKIIINGQDMTNADSNMWNSIRGKDVAMIFQEPMTSLNPLMKVGYQIAENAVNRGVPKELAKEKALEMMRLAGLPDPSRLYNCYPHQLSGGQRQRIMICLALINRPKLLIADEPTTALDVTIQAQVLDIIKDMSRQTGTAVLIITHDLGVVSHLCDRTYVMYAGSIAESGDTKNLINSPKHPYTKGLLGCLPDISKKGQRLQNIKYSVPPLEKRPENGCIYANRCDECMECCTQITPQIVSLKDRQIACHKYAAEE